MFFTLVACALVAPDSNIKSDETVVFFPTWASLDAETSQWTVQVHGVIFEPEEDSRKRAALLSVLRRRFDLPRGSAEAERFESRMRRFLVDNERGKQVVVQLAGQTRVLAESTANGHFRGRFHVGGDQLDELDEAKLADGPVWRNYSAVTSPAESRRFVGHVQFVGRRGLSVISDIDDTIKNSHVTDKSELLKNTFFRPFRAVPGMAKMYTAWAERGVAFHYVSGSPWQLYEPLETFRAETGFPRGTFHLRPFRLKDRSLLEALSPPLQHKTGSIEPLLAVYRERKFVLVGDAGEQDPEIYAALARQHPEQIVGVFIRLLPEDQQPDQRERLAHIAEELKPGVFHTFSDPQTLEATMRRLVEARD